MAKYMIYTSEGFCEDPNGNAACNCQLLGRAVGESEEEAIKNFFRDNEWAENAGFDPNEAQCAKLDDSEWV